MFCIIIQGKEIEKVIHSFISKNTAKKYLEEEKWNPPSRGDLWSKEVDGFTKFAFIVKGEKAN